MKKNKKIIAAALLTVAAAIVLISCSKKSSGSGALTEAPRVQTDADTAAAETTKTSETVAPKDTPEEALFEEDTEYEEETYEEETPGQFEEIDDEELFYKLAGLVKEGNITADMSRNADFLLDFDRSLPETFDLRDYDFVTPVKNQEPFGCCWAFGAIAAAETSILSETEQTYEETGLNLSERHLTWFSISHLSEDDPQSGEGVYKYDSDVSPYERGSSNSIVTKLFSSGIGIADEDTCPYISNENTYDEYDDWSVSEDLKYTQVYELEETRILPEFKAGNPDAIYAAKSELYEGRGISASYYNSSEYMNYDTYGYYVPEFAHDNHAICIIGWDDNFSSENFLNHEKDGEDSEALLPPGDGAWIIKNSWGSEFSEGHDQSEWGRLDEDGMATGYFYISYYDNSLCHPVTMNFKTTEDEPKSEIRQYDCMLGDDNYAVWTDEDIFMSNTFEAGEGEYLRSISVETVMPGTTVDYVIYILDDRDDDIFELDAAEQGTESFVYGGYHMIDLPEPLSLDGGKYYAICVKETFEYEDVECSAISANLGYNRDGTEKARAEYDNDAYDLYYKGVINPGESTLYFPDYGKKVDWSEFIDRYKKEIDSDYEYDNFAIKALVVKDF